MFAEPGWNRPIIAQEGLEQNDATDIDRLREYYQERANSLDREIRELNQILMNYEINYKREGKEAQQLQKKINKQQIKINEQKKRLQSYKEINVQRDKDDQTKRTLIQGLKKETQKQKLKIQDLNKQQQQNEKLEFDVKRLQKDLDLLQQEKKQQDSELKKFRAKYKDKKKHIKNIEAQLTGLEKELYDTKSKLKDLTEQKDNQQKEFHESLKNLKNANHVLEKDNQKYKKDNQKYIKLKDNYNKLKDSHNKETEDLKNKYLKSIEIQNKEYQENIDIQNKANTRLEKELYDTKSKLKDLTEQKDNQQKEFHESLKNLKNANHVLEKDNQKYKKDNQKYIKLKDNYNKLKDSHNKETEDLKNKYLKSIEIQNKEYQENIDIQDKANTKFHESLEKEYKDKIRKIIKESNDQMQGVNDQMQEVNNENQELQLQNQFLLEQHWSRMIKDMNSKFLELEINHQQDILHEELSILLFIKNIYWEGMCNSLPNSYSQDCLKASPWVDGTVFGICVLTSGIKDSKCVELGKYFASTWVSKMMPKEIADNANKILPENLSYIIPYMPYLLIDGALIIAAPYARASWVIVASHTTDLYLERNNIEKEESIVPTSIPIAVTFTYVLCSMYRNPQKLGSYKILNKIASGVALGQAIKSADIFATNINPIATHIKNLIYSAVFNVDKTEIEINVDKTEIEIYCAPTYKQQRKLSEIVTEIDKGDELGLSEILTGIVTGNILDQIIKSLATHIKLISSAVFNDGKIEVKCIPYYVLKDVANSISTLVLTDCINFAGLREKDIAALQNYKFDKIHYASGDDFCDQLVKSCQNVNIPKKHCLKGRFRYDNALLLLAEDNISGITCGNLDDLDSLTGEIICDNNIDYDSI